MEWPPSADETGLKSKGRNIMIKTINGEDFYLLAAYRYEAAYFVRHLDGDELGFQWELKRIIDGEVVEMENEFFFSSSDLLKHIPDAQMFATLNDDGCFDAKDVEIDYVVMARNWNDGNGWDIDEYVMDDENIDTYGPYATDDGDLDDFSWMDEFRNPFIGYKENGRDAKIYAVLKSAGTDVIIKKGDKVLASEDERLSKLMEYGYGEEDE